MSQLRCAIYAHNSTDSETPFPSTIRFGGGGSSRRGAVGRRSTGIYFDEAISGATDDRSGLKNLLDAATAPAHPLDVILVDDTSRLRRKLADSLRIFE